MRIGLFVYSVRGIGIEFGWAGAGFADAIADAIADASAVPSCAELCGAVPSCADSPSMAHMIYQESCCWQCSSFPTFVCD